MYLVDFHPMAIKDYKQARNWYRRHAPSVELRFRDAVEAALRRVENSFDRLASLTPGYRFAKLKKFPHILIAMKRADETLLIVAVAHPRRRPGYWRRRK